MATKDAYNAYVTRLVDIATLQAQFNDMSKQGKKPNPAQKTTMRELKLVAKQEARGLTANQIADAEREAKALMTPSASAESNPVDANAESTESGNSATNDNHDATPDPEPDANDDSAESGKTDDSADASFTFNIAESDVMKALKRRITGNVESALIETLRSATKLHFAEYGAFVSIALAPQESGNTDRSSIYVKTRSNGYKPVTALTESADDDIQFIVTIGYNVTHSANLTGRLSAFKDFALGKSEEFHLYLKADATWDFSGVELPEKWLIAKLAKFVTGQERKNQWKGSQKKGYTAIIKK
jgi:hypothetical protein